MSKKVHFNPILLSAVNFMALIVWLSLQAGQVLAFDVVELHDDDQLIALGPYAESLEDASGSLSLGDVLQQENQPKWKRSDSEMPNFGITSSAIWLRVPLNNLGKSNDGWLFEIAQSNIDQIDVFVIPVSGKPPLRYQLGNKHHSDQHINAEPKFVVPLALERNELTWIYLRVVNDFTIKLPIYILKQEALSEKRQVEFLIQGSYFGLMAIMALYNLFIYFSLRDKSYLYYTLFVACFAAWFFIEQGYAFQYLWPNSVYFNSQIHVTFLAIAATLSIVFTNEFLSLKRKSNALHRGVKCLIYVWLGVILCAVLLPVQMVMKLIIFTALPGGALLLFSGIYMRSKGVVAARYYTIAWAVIIPGSMLYSLTSLGLIPSNLVTENSFQFGSIIEVFLFSLGLASRIKTAQFEKQRAQEESIKYLGRYRGLYQNAIRGIFQASSQGAFISANPALVALLGYDSESTLIASINNFGDQHFVDVNEWARFERKTIEHGKALAVEIKGKRVNGDIFWGELSARRVELSGNTGWIYEGTLLDISERKEKEAAQKESLLLKANVEKERADAQQELNQQLEMRVHERTQKLEETLDSLQEANDKLLRLNTEDGLTGVMNRRFFEENYGKEWKRARREQASISLIVIDIDYFKAVNDRYGHLGGDECLKQVATVFQEIVKRPVDAVSRYGGEEFVITLPNTDLTGACFIAEKIRVSIASSVIDFQGELILLTVSLGVAAIIPEDAMLSDQLFSWADSALYKAKKSGRNKVEHHRSVTKN